MANSHHKNQMTRSIAVTLRPKGGLTKRHEILFEAYLKKNAEQWEFYEEFLNDDPSTRHLHGRILFEDHKRMDKIKDKLVISMDMIQAEKKVLLKGIKWLYDDWEYAGKDGEIWKSNITDEDAWEYADPANKYEKKKNAQTDHYIELLQDDLPPEVTWQDVHSKMLYFWATNLEEMPGTSAARGELAKKVALICNARNANPHWFNPDADMDMGPVD